MAANSGMSLGRIAEDLQTLWHANRIPVLLIFFVVLCRNWWVKRKQSGPFRPKTSNIREGEQSKTLSIAALERTEWLNQQNLKAPERVPQNGEVAPKSRRLAPRRVTGSKGTDLNRGKTSQGSKIQPIVFYFSLTETTKTFATQNLRTSLEDLNRRNHAILTPRFCDLSIIDHEDYFEHLPKDVSSKDTQFFYFLLIPSYNIDTILDNFILLLRETHHDFRIDTAPLSKMAGYSVFGFGDREGWPTEATGFCSQAIEVDQWMGRLTAKKRAFPLGLGDIKSDASDRFEEWIYGLMKSLEDVATCGGLGEGAIGSGDPIESDEEEIDDDSLPKIKPVPSSRRLKGIKSNVDDLEDLGAMARSYDKPNTPTDISSAPLAIDFTTNPSPIPPNVPKPMVPQGSPTHATLTKQGYTIIGSHSGVKICRWTKSALRGRGSCYKFSFYGIKSHLCMETTPSLSCSNKCVFCWRHGTNPVGTTWRWQVDPPEMIFEGAKEGHYKKIKMLKGVPGVRAERFQEAMKIRHCALSLVGEPIFYPHINEFVGMLHREHISSFLVCNAQHPDQLEALQHVTQLYVSIDASNAESLRKIDRPLYRDYWQRFTRCLDILRERRFSMRTVYRLTLVKGFNIEEEVEGYANLVARGLPCFVEVKGVTYCGTPTTAGVGLTMQNVPFYTEVVTFVEALNSALEQRGLDYGIAAEHSHSCCALIASKRFLLNGKWHTLIDYEKFFQCLESGKPFGPEDYVGPPTPEWAVWGQGGFDPADKRVYRKGKGPKKVGAQPLPQVKT